MKQHLSNNIIPSSGKSFHHCLSRRRKHILGTVLNIFHNFNITITESKTSQSLLCDEDLERKINGDSVWMAEGHCSSMDPQKLLPDHSSDTEFKLDINLQEESHIYHDDRPNDGNDTTQLN